MAVLAAAAALVIARLRGLVSFVPLIPIASVVFLISLAIGSFIGRPLSDLRAKIKAYRAGDTSVSFAPSESLQEADDLAGDFKDLLDSSYAQATDLARREKQQMQFVGDVAHELPGPQVLGAARGLAAAAGDRVVVARERGERQLPRLGVRHPGLVVAPRVDRHVGHVEERAALAVRGDVRRRGADLAHAAAGQRLVDAQVQQLLPVAAGDEDRVLAHVDPGARLQQSHHVLRLERLAAQGARVGRLGRDVVVHVQADEREQRREEHGRAHDRGERDAAGAHRGDLAVGGEAREDQE